MIAVFICFIGSQSHGNCEPKQDEVFSFQCDNVFILTKQSYLVLTFAYLFYFIIFEMNRPKYERDITKYLISSDTLWLIQCVTNILTLLMKFTIVVVILCYWKFYFTLQRRLENENNEALLNFTLIIDRSADNFNSTTFISLTGNNDHKDVINKEGNLVAYKVRLTSYLELLLR